MQTQPQPSPPSDTEPEASADYLAYPDLILHHVDAQITTQWSMVGVVVHRSSNTPIIDVSGELRYAMPPSPICLPGCWPVNW